MDPPEPTKKNNGAQAPEPLPTGFQPAEVPTAYARHPLIVGQYYFTLPTALLQYVQTAVGSKIPAADWSREYILAAVAGDHRSQVGFLDGRPVNYTSLRDPSPLPKLPPTVSPDVKLWQNVSAAQFNNAMTEGASRVESAALVARGYCGWLVTNATFLSEHRNLLQKHEASIRQYGLAQPGFLASPGEEDFEAAAPEVQAFGADVAAHCQRWQLYRLAAPYLPEPLRPQIPLAAVSLITHAMRSGGTLIYLPHIFPVPSRDELRDVIDDAMHARTPPPHLAEWMKVIDVSNASKSTQMSRYARIFEIQHYLRQLRQRYPEALKRQMTKLRGVLANFFGIGEETLESDLKQIRDAQRGSASSSGPA